MILLQIKGNVKGRGKSYKELIEKMNQLPGLRLSYGQFEQYVNGFTKRPPIPDFERRVEQVLKNWDEEHNNHKGC